MHPFDTSNDVIVLPLCMRSIHFSWVHLTRCAADCIEVTQRQWNMWLQCGQHKNGFSCRFFFLLLACQCEMQNCRVSFYGVRQNQCWTEKMRRSVEQMKRRKMHCIPVRCHKAPTKTNELQKWIHSFGSVLVRRQRWQRRVERNKSRSNVGI